jgi:protocatechuate 3,4-dioxygenase alpha subunit
MENELVAHDDERAVRLAGRLLDGEEEPIGDGLIEVWDPVARLWGRGGTDVDGGFSFFVPRPAEDAIAPHLDVFVFARGLLRHQRTRIYFPGYDADETLGALVPEARTVLVAEGDGDGLRFDIRLQGDHQTVFFDH